MSITFVQILHALLGRAVKGGTLPEAFLFQQAISARKACGSFQNLRNERSSRRKPNFIQIGLLSSHPLVSRTVQLASILGPRGHLALERGASPIMAQRVLNCMSSNEGTQWG